VIKEDQLTATVPDDVEFDLYDERFFFDPWPVYQKMRDETPLFYSEKHDFYAVSRWDDVHNVFHDPQTYSSARGGILEVIKMNIEMPSGVLIFEDPPSHSIHRKLVSRLFTPKRIKALEPQLREFCREVLDPLVGQGEFDVIRALSAHLPMRAICLLVGIPLEDQEFVRDAVDKALTTESGEAMTEDGLLFTGDVFMKFVEEREKNPTDDIISQLLTQDFTDEHGEVRKLTKDEVCTYITVISGAGNETTGRLIGWATKYWADYPDARRELREDFSLIPNAIEEIVRIEPPGQAVARYVTKDVEVHGTTIKKGDIMLAAMASANRDPRHFPDPDTYDIHRKDVAHMGFGAGIHFCLGNALARLEGQVAMEEMLKRFGDWEVDMDRAVLAKTSTVRGWKTLPVIPG
jgi:cytochrome P450